MSDWFSTDDDYSAGSKQGGSSGNFDPLPVGQYNVEVGDVQVAQTAKKKQGQADKGEMIKVEFLITDGPFAGRKIWNNYNIENDNEMAANIGRREFSELCKAAGASIKIKAPESDVWEERKVRLDAQLVALMGYSLTVKTENRKVGDKTFTGVKTAMKRSLTTTITTTTSGNPFDMENIPF
jgi:hypothetical protein